MGNDRDSWHIDAVSGNARTMPSVTASGSKREEEDPAPLAEFPPEYFALAMATGIVSLAANDQGREIVARVLFGINLIAYLVLWVLTVARFFRNRAGFMDDLTHHFHSAAFLTIVAATCILGCQFIILTSWTTAALLLWFAGIGLWILLNYTFFTVVTVRDPKPPLEAGINGVWLLTVVAIESISALGALIAPFLAKAQFVLFLSLTAYLIGAAFYIFFITLILYRWMFFRMKPEKLTPDYWIDMGALAIATLSGTFLLSAAGHWNLLQELAPFLMGFTLLFWAMATWWIPLLLIVEIWRHLLGRVPFIYSPDYWSLVFPLGMYSVATSMLARVTDMTFLKPLATLFACLAAAAWCMTFFGLVRHLARKFL